MFRPLGFKPFQSIWAIEMSCVNRLIRHAHLQLEFRTSERSSYDRSKDDGRIGSEVQIKPKSESEGELTGLA
jgi:hypothetical protein